VFAAGAVLVARPFAKNWLIWLAAVPVAAVVGVLLLGAAALIVTVIVAAASADAPLGDTSTTRRTKKRAAPAAEVARFPRANQPRTRMRRRFACAYADGER
jgi:hypothetical protein